MAPDEAVLLNWLFRHTSDTTPEGLHHIEILKAHAEAAGDERVQPFVGLSEEDFATAYVKSGFGRYYISDSGIPVLEATREFEVCFESLQAAGLVCFTSEVKNFTRFYGLTFLGNEFVKACTPPKPKENG